MPITPLTSPGSNATGLPSDIPPNATCDICPSGSTTPRISNVLFWLAAQFENIKPISAGNNYTHYCYFGLGMDIRNNDDIYVPSAPGGTKFTIVTIQRINRQTPADRMIAFLNIQANPPFPTNEL